MPGANHIPATGHDRMPRLFNLYLIKRHALQSPDNTKGVSAVGGMFQSPDFQNYLAGTSGNWTKVLPNTAEPASADFVPKSCVHCPLTAFLNQPKCLSSLYYRDRNTVLIHFYSLSSLSPESTSTMDFFLSKVSSYLGLPKLTGVISGIIIVCSVREVKYFLLQV